MRLGSEFIRNFIDSTLFQDYQGDVFCLRQLPRFEWLVSPAMHRLNYIAAIVTLPFIFARIYLVRASQSAEFAPAGEAVLTWLLVAGALSYAILFVSMVYFWLTFGRGENWSGTFWLIGMAITPLITVIYCFTSYRRFVCSRPAQQHSIPEVTTS
jgi:hypothetical protein